MKRISYLYPLLVSIGDGKTEMRLFPNCMEVSESDFETNLAVAKAEVYNGEVAVEEVPDPEPAAPSQAEELAELREQLKTQQAIIKALLGEE